MRRNAVSGVLFGVGLAGFIDETVFHQLLHWHKFYDGSTPELGLVSDGIFHAFGWLASVAALLLLAQLFRHHAVQWRRWWGAVLIGTGAFNLYDGTVQHKLLRLHQIRYNVDLLPYDLTWNISASVVIAIGVAMWISAARVDAAAARTE